MNTDFLKFVADSTAVQFSGGRFDLDDVTTLELTVFANSEEGVVTIDGYINTNVGGKHIRLPLPQRTCNIHPATQYAETLRFVADAYQTGWSVKRGTIKECVK
jgi:hypothetical protein